ATSIRERAAAAGLDDRLRFVESTTAVQPFFAAADVYVLPSIREGLPIALLEAMASGLACIASRLPGSTDTMIADGVNGLLVAPDDRDGLTAALRRLVHDCGCRGRLGAAARQTVLDRYSIRGTAGAWMAAYAEMAGAQ